MILIYKASYFIFQKDLHSFCNENYRFKLFHLHYGNVFSRYLIESSIKFVFFKWQIQDID